MTLQNALNMLRRYVQGKCRNGEFSEAQLMEARGVMNEAAKWLTENGVTTVDLYDYINGKANDVSHNVNGKAGKVSDKAYEWDALRYYEVLCDGPEGRRPG